MVPKLRFKSYKDKWNLDYLKKLIVSLDAGVSVNSLDESPDENEFSILKTSCVSLGYFNDMERKKVIADEEVARLKERLISDSILISRMNTPLLVGANAYINSAPKNTFVPDRLWQVKINKDVCNMQWLACFLSSDKGRSLLREQASGTSNSMKNITKNDVFQIEICYPSKEEQTKIADFLSSVDKKLMLLNKQYDLLCQYKKGMMQKIFSQELRFKDENGEAFPEWKFINAGKIFKNSSNKKHNGDLPVLAVTQENGVVKRDDINIDIKSSQSSINSYKIIEKGDFVISLRSFQGGIEYSFIKGICSPAYTILKNIKPIVGDFYRFYLKKESFIEELSQTVVGIRDGKQISYQAFATLSLPSPCLTEQEKIANVLSAIDCKITSKKAELDKLKTWKQGLLQQMFV
ncbi:restriction endonuclease subunit S [Xenorhabdus sp. XENO-10]|uniref:Restriction endonuclease subunit S n=1 Tax=Xenorhabdus yunnanensis TaxID=3025878 RepID=A0ABT5LGS7_9GAMM|nr:restriction endonuclease subunit S [Xenorhabdus yunnanensis]MDC9590305.1 restriction endonuclease subunit S [Xenorhabdus yunnanensis]